MPDAPPETMGELERLARERFTDPPLTEAELRLLRAAPKGDLAVCGPNEDDNDPENDPAKAEMWTGARDRRIRADLIRWLCVDRQAKELIDPKGIRAYGATIDGGLDISYSSIPVRLVLRRCHFPEPMRLQDIEIAQLDFNGSLTRGITADGAIVRGDVFLRNDFRSEGEVRFLGAQIGGDLSCNKASFRAPAIKDDGRAGDALSLDRAVVKGGVFLHDGFRAEGQVRLMGAQIGSNLECDSSTFSNPAQKDIVGAGTALNADGVVVGGSVFLRNGFKAEGQVRLSGAQIGGTLDCQKSTFSNPAQRGVSGTGDALSLDRAVVKGSVFLRNGFKAEGQVRLSGAQVGSNLECDSSTFSNPAQKDIVGAGTALNADGIVVGRSVSLRDGFRAEGTVRLFGAQIGGTLDCQKSTFSNPAQRGVSGTGDALSLDRAVVKGSVFLRNGFKAEGQVRLSGAQVGSNLECGNSTFSNPAQKDVPRAGQAVNAESVVVKGSAFLRDGFKAEGEVTLLGAQIGGTLDCQKSTFSNPAQRGVSGTGDALSLDRAVVKGSVFLRNGFKAEGQVRLSGAQVGSNLECDSSTFSNPPQKDIPGSGQAIGADGVVVAGSLFLSDGFRAEGEVTLLDAQIGGTLNCQKATFSNPAQKDVSRAGKALNADRAVVKGSVFLHDGFKAEGDVRLNGASVVGDLSCVSADFDGGLRLEDASVGGTLYWRSIADAEHARLDLVDAEVDTLVDDKESWPAPGKSWLDGFVYRRISGDAPRDADSRLDWLSRQEAFAPQPYRQLAKVLKEEGDDSGARKVLFEMERLRRAQGSPKWHQRLWSVILSEVVGYGYYPAKALKWLVGVVVVGFIVFWIGYARQGMAPTDADAYKEYREAGHTPAHYERFHALIYSLENTAPLVKFGQVDRWQPDPNPQRCVKCLLAKSNAFSICVSLAGSLRWVRWIETVLGWVLATFFVAGVTGIVRKD